MAISFKPLYPDKTIDLSQVTDKLHHIMLYRVHHAIRGFPTTIRSQPRHPPPSLTTYIQNLIPGGGGTRWGNSRHPRVRLQSFSDEASRFRERLKSYPRVSELSGTFSGVWFLFLTRYTGARGTGLPPSPLFSNFLFTNLFSITFLYFFIISSIFPFF